MSFVHLHVHSVYSLLDGYSKLKKLVTRAREMGMPAIALTDHGTMFGAIDFYTLALKAGIKPIIGVEGYLAVRTMQDRDSNIDKKSYHLLMLAENDAGYKNLLKLSSAAQLEGFYYRPRVDKELLAAHSEGLICTTGCMAADVPQAILHGNIQEAQKRLDWYYEVFGDRFFIELQQHDIPEMPEMNKALIELGKRYNSQFVATNDVHYVDQKEARLQDVLLAVQTGCVLSDPKRMRMSGQDYYLRSPDEMTSLFGHIPGAISNTIAIAERCNVDLGFKGYKLPKFAVPEGHTAASYLLELCQKGLRWRYGDQATSEVVQERLQYELSIIGEMGFAAYFLIVWDLCQYAERNKIWYNARGSAAGSIVAYSLGITMVDPIEHGLIFERFLNPGRISMPDIDLDFPDDRRAQMMAYCADTYGNDKVAQIITFGKMKARAAVRDVGRVMDIPLSEVDRVAKLIPAIPGKPVTIVEARAQSQELKQLYESDPRIRDLLDTAHEMDGVVRNAGTHAAGVVITDVPVVEYLPLHRPTNANVAEMPIKSVTQYEMWVIEKLGLLKVDFLGLVTLTIMARACEFIKERYGKEYNLHNIPLDDSLSYELIGRGDTAGVFQVEGAGMRRYLMQMKPKNLDHVVAMIALFRPGPMEFIPKYIARMHGLEPVEYRHPALEPIFKDTYGIPVYQEQIMRAAVELAGYKASDSDGLRKAISKKVKEQLMAHRDQFVTGAQEKGISEEIANQIFDDWEEFARYGFNKSHAVAYGVIAVQTAYLKAHYPVEYMAAVLTASSNDIEKVAQYVADCRKMAIQVLPPDVNVSTHEFSIEDIVPGRAAIRFGMAAVKNVGAGPVEIICKARDAGLFVDLDDFLTRVDLRMVGKRALEALIKVGGLDRFGSRAAILQVIDRLLAVSTSLFRAADAGQMSLFGQAPDLVQKIKLPKTTEVNQRDILTWEKELIGLYVSTHPLAPYLEELDRAVSHYSTELPELKHGVRVRVAGMVNRIRYITTKKGQPMAFATIEDMHGNMELVIFPKTWGQYRDLVVSDQVILVEGTIDAKDSDPKILVDRIATEFTYHTSADRGPVVKSGNGLVQRPEGNGSIHGEGHPNASDAEEPDAPVQAPTMFPLGDVPEEKAGSIEDWEPDENFESFEDDDEEEDDGPELFPVDWEDRYSPQDDSDSGDEMIVEDVPDPIEKEKAALPTPDLAQKSNGSSDPAPAPVNPPDPVVEGTTEQESVRAVRETSSPNPGRNPAPERRAQNVSGYILPPRRRDQPGKANDKPHMLTITVKANGDKLRDILKIQRLYGILITYPGNDRFALYMFENDQPYLVEFPNDTIGINDEMLARLNEFVPPESINIAPITYSLD